MAFNMIAFNTMAFKTMAFWRAGSATLPVAWM